MFVFLNLICEQKRAFPLVTISREPGKVGFSRFLMFPPKWHKGWGRPVNESFASWLRSLATDQEDFSMAILVYWRVSLLTYTDTNSAWWHVTCLSFPNQGLEWVHWKVPISFHWNCDKLYSLTHWSLGPSQSAKKHPYETKGFPKVSSLKCLLNTARPPPTQKKKCQWNVPTIWHSMYISPTLRFFGHDFRSRIAMVVFHGITQLHAWLEHPTAPSEKIAAFFCW